MAVVLLFTVSLAPLPESLLLEYRSSDVFTVGQLVPAVHTVPEGLGRVLCQDQRHFLQMRVHIRKCYRVR